MEFKPPQSIITNRLLFDSRCVIKWNTWGYIFSWSRLYKKRQLDRSKLQWWWRIRWWLEPFHRPSTFEFYNSCWIMSTIEFKSGMLKWINHFQICLDFQCLNDLLEKYTLIKTDINNNRECRNHVEAHFIVTTFIWECGHVFGIACHNLFL